MNINSLGYLALDPSLQNKLGRHPLASSLGLGGANDFNGFLAGDSGAMSIPALGQGSSGTAFNDLVALAAAQSELAAQKSSSSDQMNRDALINLAQMRAMSLNGEMLQSLAGLDMGGQAKAENLVGRANLEALLSSGQFQDLAGGRKTQSPAEAVLNTGRQLSGEPLKAWPKRSEASRRPAAEDDKRNPGGRSAAPSPSLYSAQGGLRMPYGLSRLPKVGDSAQLETAAAKLDGDAQPVPASQAMTMAEARLSAARASVQAEAKDRPEPAEAKAAGAQSGAEKSAGEPLAMQKLVTADSEEFSREKLDQIVDKVSLALDMDASLIKAVIKTESNFNHTAVSKAGAQGLMQLMPGTAKELGVKDPFNPVENIWGGARYLKQMLDRHRGNLDKALASYNWGPGNFDRYGKSRMPRETRNYIARVNQHYAAFKKSDAGNRA